MASTNSELENLAFEVGAVFQWIQNQHARQVRDVQRRGDPNWTRKVIVWLLHAWFSSRETGAAEGGLPSLSFPEHRSARGSEVTCSFAQLGHPP